MSVNLTYTNEMQSGLSPSGQRYFVDCNPPQPTTCIVSGMRQLYVQNEAACFWIDDDHMLAPDAVISMPPSQFPFQEQAGVYPVPASGTCAGRFPAGL